MSEYLIVVQLTSPLSQDAVGELVNEVVDDVKRAHLLAEEDIEIVSIKQIDGSSTR